MGRQYKGQNLADTHLVVGSLEVLGSLGGSGVTEIKKSVESIQQQNQAFKMQIDDYWSQLVDDGLITPFEKEQLKREFQNIQLSKAALFAQASAQELQGTDYFRDYLNSFSDLDTYLNVTLDLFSHMDENTEIADRDVFNTYFSNYYYSEKFVTMALATGIMGNLGFKTIDSLDAPGTEGEVALYRGQIYQYVDGHWEAVGLEGYQGTLESLPSANQNQYFMAADDFTVGLPLYLNETPLYVNGVQLYVNRQFEKGFIYVYNNNQWIKISDTTDYRYVVAMVDYINITGELPGAFQEAIDKSAEELNKKIQNTKKSLAEEIETRKGQYTIINGDLVKIENETLPDIISRLNAQQTDLNKKISHLPAFLGTSQSNPTNAQEGDYYVYSGTTTASRKNSWIYLYKNNAWTELNPTDPSVSSYYMMCADVILAMNNPTEGYFSAVFAASFFGNQATLNSLGVQTIKIRQGGCIQSDQTSYIPGVSGMKIDANGKTELNNDVNINGNTQINGNLHVTGEEVKIDGIGYIGSKMKVNGDISGASGTFTGDIYCNGSFIAEGSGYIGRNIDINGDISGASGTFTGNINCGGNFNVSGSGKIGKDITIEGDISGASGTFKGGIEASYAKLKTGVIKNYIYIDTNLDDLNYHLSRYSEKNIYDASGFVVFSDKTSWWSSTSGQFEILNIVCGEGFIAINGYTEDIGVNANYQLAGTISLSGSSEWGYYIDNGLYVTGHTEASLGYGLSSIIVQGGTWYYYKGHNMDINSFNKTGSLSASTKIRTCITY